jgi:hypothetical protein
MDDPLSEGSGVDTDNRRLERRVGDWGGGGGDLGV